MPTKRNVYYCCVIKFNCHEKTDHHDFSAICQKLNEMKKWLHHPHLFGYYNIQFPLCQKRGLTSRFVLYREINFTWLWMTYMIGK